MVGDNIIRLREQCGYKQAELAELLGIQRQTLFKYEKNIVTNIPLDRIEKMASILGVNPSAITGWDDNTINEERLISAYRTLNDEGRHKVCDYAYDLVNSGRYKKNSITNKMEA